MTRLYSHFTIAVKPADLTEFERKLQKIKDSLGIESTSTVFQKMVDEWADLYWKAQRYDQLKEIILGFEAYYKHKEGVLDAEKEKD
ncbi:MAG: hypothetical protein HXS44_10115 [Theionarchaea archaeon]|nr:hypothetical protein [Theionarchaea archaeon]